MQRKNLSIGIVALTAVCGLARADEGRTLFLHFGTVDRDVAGNAKQCEFEFTLWDAPEGGERIGKTLIYDGWEANKARVAVDKGRFEVVLDFGIEIFDDEPLFVESRSACGRNAKWATVSRVAVTEDLLVEGSRLEVIEASIERVTPSGPSRLVQIAEPDGPDESAGTFNNTLDAADGDPSPAVVVDVDGNTAMIGDLAVGGALGTAGDLTVGGVIDVTGPRLDINVNGVRALRFEYSDALSEAPNVIGGSPSNSVVPQKAGAVIAGGGSDTGPNQVSEDWGTVSGGRSNHAFGMFGTVSGGSGNTATGEGSTVSGGPNGDAVGLHSTVGGGIANAANGDRSTVAGGTTNTADGAQSSIGGGQGNLAGGAYASVPGGFANSAAGDYSFAGGRRAKAMHTGSFVWADSLPADFSSTGNDQFLIRAAGGVAIGSSTPTGTLTIANNEDDGQGSPSGGITFNTTLASGFGHAAIYADGSTGFNGSLVFATDGDGTRNYNPTEKMRITPSGNVGIGTTTPGIPLTFANALGNKISLWGQDGAQEHFGLGIQGGTLQMYAPASTRIAFGHGRSEAFTERMQVATNGKVGIGGVFPSHQLTIASTGNDDTLRLMGPDGSFRWGARLNFGDGDFVYLDEPADDELTIFAANKITLSSGGSINLAAASVSTSGNVTVGGNISFGSASGFTHFGPVARERRNSQGCNVVAIIQSAKAFCSLSLMNVEDIDSNAETAQCNVYISGGWWYVQACLGPTGDADVLCQARCLRWD